MRSATSYFNKTLFAKAASRAWPVWATYLAVWLVMLPLPILGKMSEGAEKIDIVRAVLAAGNANSLFISLIFAVLSAMSVFYFMYNAKYAGMMAALPTKREGVFLSQLLAGLLPMLAVDAAVFLLTLGTEAYYGLTDLDSAACWLGQAALEYVIFYGFAVLCAQLTGNILVLPFVYTLLNFAAAVVEFVVGQLLPRIIYGMTSVCGEEFTFLSPAVYMISHTGAHMPYESMGAVAVDGSLGGFSGWGILGAYAAVSVICMALAMLMYKRRRMETAASAVAVEPLKPVFKYCMAAGSALVLGAAVMYIVAKWRSWYGMFWILLAMMIVCGLAGYCLAEILIRKSARLPAKSWAGWGIFTAILIALLLSFRLDLFGFEKRVPEAEDVESVSIIIDGDYLTLYKPENIEKTIGLHKDIVSAKKRVESERTTDLSIRLRYELSGDRSLVREYYMSSRDEALKELMDETQELVNVPEAVMDRKATGISVTPDTVLSCRVVSYAAKNGTEDVIGDEYSFSAADAYELYSQCVLPDMQDGNIGRIWLDTDNGFYDTVYDCTIYISLGERNADGEWIYDTFQTTVTADSLRTAQWLTEHGVNLELLKEHK